MNHRAKRILTGALLLCTTWLSGCENTDLSQELRDALSGGITSTFVAVGTVLIESAVTDALER